MAYARPNLAPDSATDRKPVPLLGALPGLLLCGGVALGAMALEAAQTALFGRAWLEGLVLAILIGTAIRTAWTPSERFAGGITWSAKVLLEIAVAVMGATISFGALAAAGWPLLLGIIGTVVCAITLSLGIGLLCKLPWKMALLIACGNAICGNSAIAAVAPVIDAEAEDTATAIAFTAVLGIAVVLLMPVLAIALHLSALAGGALAGLTVYAVPQVLAAAGPLGTAAVQMGTLVKLTRVLMLGPVVAVLACVTPRKGAEMGGASLWHRLRHGGLAHMLPPFILAFLGLAALRSLGVIPDGWVEPAQSASAVMTVLAMAGLGLGVDLRHVAAAGPRVTAVVTLSILLLTGIALAVLHLTGLA